MAELCEGGKVIGGRGIRSGADSFQKCRGFCPLGAFYGLTARFAITRMGIDHSTCIDCGACNRVCPAELDVPREVGGPECIACGDCMAACSQNGIHRTFGLIERKKT